MVSFRTLIIDADSKRRDAMVFGLTRAGCVVRATGDAREALELARTERPELVLASTMVEAMAPAELLGALREVGANAPAIVVGDEERRDEMRAAGADFLARPVFLRDALTLGRLAIAASAAGVGGANGAAEAKIEDFGLPLGLHHLARALHAGRRTALVAVERAGGIGGGQPRAGGMRFVDGEAVVAQAGRLSGSRAFMQMMLWERGRVRVAFTTARTVEERRVNRPTAQLLEEGLRFVADFRRGADQVGSADAVYARDEARIEEVRARIPAEVQAVLPLIDGARTVLDLVEEAQFKPFDMLRIVFRLGELGAIVRRPLVRMERMEKAKRSAAKSLLGRLAAPRVAPPPLPRDAASPSVAIPVEHSRVIRTAITVPQPVIAVAPPAPAPVVVVPAPVEKPRIVPAPPLEALALSRSAIEALSPGGVEHGAEPEQRVMRFERRPSEPQQLALPFSLTPPLPVRFFPQPMVVRGAAAKSSPAPSITPPRIIAVTSSPSVTVRPSSPLPSAPIEPPASPMAVAPNSSVSPQQRREAIPIAVPSAASEPIPLGVTAAGSEPIPLRMEEAGSVPIPLEVLLSVVVEPEARVVEPPRAQAIPFASTSGEATMPFVRPSEDELRSFMTPVAVPAVPPAGASERGTGRVKKAQSASGTGRFRKSDSAPHPRLEFDPLDEEFFAREAELGQIEPADSFDDLADLAGGGQATTRAGDDVDLDTIDLKSWFPFSTKSKKPRARR